MKTETKRILEKAQAGDAEAQYLTGLYYEDKGNADEAFLWYDRSYTGIRIWNQRRCHILPERDGCKGMIPARQSLF